MFAAPYRQAWDLAVDICLSQLPTIIEEGTAFRVSQGGSPSHHQQVQDQLSYPFPPSHVDMHAWLGVCVLSSAVNWITQHLLCSETQTLLSAILAGGPLKKVVPTLTGATLTFVTVPPDR